MAMSASLRLPLPPLTRQSASRAIVAGATWGAVFTAGFTAYAWAACGAVCLDEVLLTAAISMAGGIVAIGPLAAFGR